MPKRTLTKSGRLLLLYLLRKEGVLEDQTLQEIGDIFGCNRSTVLRDLREVDEVERQYQQLMATQPWVRRDYSTAEFSEETGLSPETVRALINDGAIRATKIDEQWHIPRHELQRWKEILT